MRVFLTHAMPGNWYVVSHMYSKRCRSTSPTEYQSFQVLVLHAHASTQSFQLQVLQVFSRSPATKAPTDLGWGHETKTHRVDIFVTPLFFLER